MSNLLKFRETQMTCHFNPSDWQILNILICVVDEGEKQTLLYSYQAVS